MEPQLPPGLYDSSLPALASHRERDFLLTPKELVEHRISKGSQFVGAKVDSSPPLEVTMPPTAITLHGDMLLKTAAQKAAPATS